MTYAAAERLFSRPLPVNWIRRRGWAVGRFLSEHAGVVIDVRISFWQGTSQVRTGPWTPSPEDRAAEDWVEA